MQTIYLLVQKNLVRICLVLQIGFLTGAIKDIGGSSSYTWAALKHLFFSTTAINHQFNFFTFPKDKKVSYSYFRSSLILLGLNEKEELISRQISQNGGLAYLVNPANRCRIANIIPVTFRDTLLFEAVARSEALYFLNSHPDYKALKFEIYQNTTHTEHDGRSIRQTFTVDTVYSRIFYLED